MAQANDVSLDLRSSLTAAGLVGSWFHDTSADRVVSDPAVALLFGIGQSDGSSGDAIDRYASAVHPADREEFVEQVTMASTRGGSFACHYRIIAGHQHRWVYDFGSFELDENGKRKHGRGIIIDISDQMARDVCMVDKLVSPRPELCRQIADFADHVISAGHIARILPSPRLSSLLTPLLWETGRLIAKLKVEATQRRSAKARFR